MELNSISNTGPAELRGFVSQALALVMETVREPALHHLLAVLQDTDERALLLMRCRNPEIRAFWLAVECANTSPPAATTLLRHISSRKLSRGAR